MIHETLSQSLAKIVADKSSCYTLNGLIQRTEGRGLYVILIVLCLPFISPFPVPGLSNIFGAIISLMAIQLARNRPAKLPDILGEKKFSPKRIQQIVRATSRFLSTLEKLAKPRHSKLLLLRSVRWSSAVSFFLMGLLLALPIPPIVPFSNSLPSWGIILIALATMERDGLMIWIGYAVAIGAFVYLALIAGVCITSLERIFNLVQTFVGH